MLGGAILLLLSIAAPLAAWSKQSHVDIAWEAARLAPVDLYRQIIRHKFAYRDGLVAPWDETDRTRHEKNQDGSGSLDLVIAAEAARAVQSIETHQPFQTVVYQLGVVLHYVIEANNPLSVSSQDPLESTYAADFNHYVDTATPRMPALFYGLDTRLQGPQDLVPWVGRTIARSRRLYPYIGQEYRRIDGCSGSECFDDRSTAFGVAAVSFSRAMTDAVVMLRYAWLEAGGADTLPREPLESHRLLKLPRGR